MRRFVVTYKWWLAAALAAVAVAVAVVVAWDRDVPAAPPPDPSPVVEAPAPARLPLTGLPIDVLPERPALLVKVSNSPEARPQTGLEAADVVFEELVEGGVTRYLAVFHGQLPEVVGPVRSARPVDVQLAGGFGRPGLAYSGGRPEVRTLLSSAPIVTITEGAPGFFRDGGRYASHPFAPHDLFLRVHAGLAAVEAAGAVPLGDVGWVFDERPPPGGRPGAEVEVAMSSFSRTSWAYDAVASRYRRAQNGVPSLVTGDGRIGAANVVVLDVHHYLGASGYPETDVLGTGPATVLRDGRRYVAAWSKPTAARPLQIVGTDGEPFVLAPGPTWILLPDVLPG